MSQAQFGVQPQDQRPPGTVEIRGRGRGGRGSEEEEHRSIPTQQNTRTKDAQQELWIFVNILLLQTIIASYLLYILPPTGALTHVGLKQRIQ